MNTNRKPAVKRKRSSCTKYECKTVTKTKKRCSNNEKKKYISKVYESGEISANELHESKNYASSTDTNLPINHSSGPSLKVELMLDCKSDENQFEKDSNIDCHSKGENSLLNSKTIKSFEVKEDEELNREKIEENLIKNTSTTDFIPKKEVRFKLDCKPSDENQFEKSNNIGSHSKGENSLLNCKTIKSFEIKEDGEPNKEKIEENLIKNTSTPDFTPKKEERFKLDCKPFDENQFEKSNNIGSHSKRENSLLNSKTIKSFEVKEDGELHKEKIEGNLIQNISSEKDEGAPSNLTAEDSPDFEDEFVSEDEQKFFLGDFPPNPIISNKIKDLVNNPSGFNEDSIFSNFEDSPDSEDEIAKPNENKQNNLVKASEVYHNTVLVEKIKNLVTPFGINKDLIFSKSESSVPFRGGMFVIKPFCKPFRERLFDSAEKNTSAKIPPETLYEKFDAVDLMRFYYIPENLNFMRGCQNQESFAKDHPWFSWFSNSSYPEKSASNCTSTKSDSEKINYEGILNNILPEGHPWFSRTSNSSCPEEIVHDSTSAKSDSEKINYEDVLNNILPEGHSWRTSNSSYPEEIVHDSTSTKCDSENMNHDILNILPGEKSPEKKAKSFKKRTVKKSHSKKRNHAKKETTKKEKKPHSSRSSRKAEFINLNKQVPENFSSAKKLKIRCSIPLFKLLKKYIHND